MTETSWFPTSDAISGDDDSGYTVSLTTNQDNDIPESLEQGSGVIICGDHCYQILRVLSSVGNKARLVVSMCDCGQEFDHKTNKLESYSHPMEFRLA